MDLHRNDDRKPPRIPDAGRNPDAALSPDVALNPDWVEACKALDASRALHGPARGGLTERQRDALHFIERFIETNGYSPNFREIAFGLGLKSNASIARLTSALEERGFIARRYARRRSITLLTQA